MRDGAQKPSTEAYRDGWERTFSGKPIEVEIKPGQVWKYVDDPTYPAPFSILASHPTESGYWILSITRYGQHVGISSDSLQRFAVLVSEPKR